MVRNFYWTQYAKGWNAVPTGWNHEGHANHWRVINPEGKDCVVTTDRPAPDYAPDRVHWWGPGHESFPNTQ